MEQDTEPFGQPRRRRLDAAVHDVRIRVPARAAELARVRRAVVASAKAHGIAPQPRADIALAVSEACANVVNHAYPGADTPGPLTVETYREDHEFVVVVSDEGTGVAPRPDSPGLGLGLALMARLAQRLEIGSSGFGGAKVTMGFPA